MFATCSRRFRIPSACSAALLLAGVALVRPLAAQQPDEGLVGELARLLAAADARTLDASLLGTALRSENPNVRRQAALAAGRIGDAAAVPLLLPALSDSDAVVRTYAAFSLGLLKSATAVPALLELVRSVPPAAQEASQIEAATALARIGGGEAVQALREILGNGSTPGVQTPLATSAALVAAWRINDRGLAAALVGYSDDPDPVVRWHALYSLGRLRAPKGAAALVGGLQDADPRVRAAAARGITRVLLDSARIQWKSVADGLRPLLQDSASAVRINALRALATFHDSSLAAGVVPLIRDVDVNVAVQAETTLGVMGGPVAVAALTPRAQNAVFALRRQALIAWLRPTAPPASRPPPASPATPIGAGGRWPPRRSARRGSAPAL